MKKGGKVARRRKQSGGDLRPRGLVQQGSGNIDPNSPYGLPMDDVNAVLGKGEYVFNANAVKELGEPFLNQLNAIGLDGSSLPRNTGMYGDYQKGGRVKKQTGGNNMARNRVRKQRGGRGRTRKQMGGGSCSSGQRMQNGACVPAGGGRYKKGGKVRRQRGGRTKPVSRKMQGGGRGGRGGSHRHNMNQQVREHKHLSPIAPYNTTSNPVWAGNQIQRYQTEGSLTGGMRNGGRTRPKPARRQTGGRGRKRFQQGSHTSPYHEHNVFGHPDGFDMGAWTGPPTNARPGGAHRHTGIQPTIPIGRGRSFQNGGGGQYVIAGTNIPYNGKTVKAGGIIYTTGGNTIDGTSQALELISNIGKGK